MTKDILKLSATFLGLDEVVEYLNTPNTTPNQEVSEKLNQLLVYTNYIIREITKEYYPLSTSELLLSDDNCQIYYTNFQEQPIGIKDIKNTSNLSVTFNLYPEYVKVGTPNSEYLVKYNFIPKPIKTIDQNFNLPIGLDYFIISYGVASEYCLSKLLYNEAELWESKFKNSLERIKSRIGDRRFYARRLK